MRDSFVFELFVLFVGTVLATFFLIYFRYNHTAQIVTSFFGCVYYVVWGIMHQASRDRLNKIIILEYILVGSLIFLLLFSAFSM